MHFMHKKANSMHTYSFYIIFLIKNIIANNADSINKN